MSKDEKKLRRRARGLRPVCRGVLAAFAAFGFLSGANAADPVIIAGSDITAAGSYAPSVLTHVSSFDEAVSLLVSTYNFTEAEAQEAVNAAYEARSDIAIDIQIQGKITLNNTGGTTYLQNEKSLFLQGSGGEAAEVSESGLALAAARDMTVAGSMRFDHAAVSVIPGTGQSTMTGDLVLKNSTQLTISDGNSEKNPTFALNGNLSVTGSEFSVAFKAANSSRFTFNGDIAVTGGTVKINEQNDSGSLLTFNGDIVLHNSTFEILSENGSDNSVVINGSIRVSGDAGSVYTAAVSYVPLPEDYGEKIPDRDFMVNRGRLSTYSYNKIWSIGAGERPGLDPVELDNKPASVFSIGTIGAKYTVGTLSSCSTNYAVSKFTGDVTVENSEETANSVWLTLDAPSDGAWTWKGSATMTGGSWQGSAYRQNGIMITAKDGAVWKVTGEENAEYGRLSTIAQWKSLGSTTIDMTASDDNLTLRIDELIGRGTTFVEKIGANSDGTGIETDLVIVGGRSSGEHTVKLAATGRPVGGIAPGEITYFKVLPLTDRISMASPDPRNENMTPEEANAKMAVWNTNTGVLYSLSKYEEVFENDSSQFNLTYEENADGTGKTATITVNGQKIYDFDGFHYLMFNVDGQVAWSYHQETMAFDPLIIHYGDSENKVDIGNYKYTILDPKILEDGTVVFNVLAPEALRTEAAAPDAAATDTLPPDAPAPYTPAPYTPAVAFEDLSDAAEVVTTLGGDGAMYSAWMADLTDLRKRLGEVRYGAQDGLWARAIAQRDRLEGVTGADFKEKLYGLQMGLDHIVTQDEDRMWLLGANLKLNTVDQKISAMRYGHGDMRSYGAFFYATYANYRGCYTDLVLSADHYKQKMTAEQTDDSYVHGRYNTWGWGASVETGKMFSSAQNDEGWGPWYSHWWVEPQAQLAYYWISGRRFSMDNDMRVRQKNGNSLIGRLGVVAGKKFNYGANRKEVDKRYSQFYLKGGVKHEFLGKQTLYVNDQKFDDRLRGTTVYYGAGFDWNLSDQLRLYAQVERERGHKYRKDYEVSAGLRWQF